VHLYPRVGDQPVADLEAFVRGVVEQLLREQPAKTRGAFDRPDPIRPRRRPRHQVLDLCPYADLSERDLVRVERERGMRSLVRVDADHHHSHDVLLE
jgi:hypothetical protein